MDGLQRPVADAIEVDLDRAFACPSSVFSSVSRQKHPIGATEVGMAIARLGPSDAHGLDLAVACWAWCTGKALERLLEAECLI